MATTLIENIINELTELVVQKVLEEFQAQEERLTVLEKKFETLAQQRLKGLTDPLDHEARLNALELERFDLVHRADLCSNFVTRDDLLVDEALINDRLVAMERALAAQPVVDANFVDERIERWMRENLHYEVTNIIDRYNMTSKIEDTLRDFDLGVEEAGEDEIRNRTLITEDDLIEFINDRVRLTTE